MKSSINILHQCTYALDPAEVDASHIMMGSDFPFGETNPVAFLQRAKNISEASREAMLGANAARFLGMAM